MRKRLLHGPALKVIRTRTGIRQTDFATTCLITPGYLSNLESGRKQPTEVLMRKFADALGVTLNDITYVVTSEATEAQDVAA